MIEMQDVTKTFGDVRALNGLNMVVPDGAVYGLVGPNGAGKTTALSHICGAMRPDSGSVLVGGASVTSNVEMRSRIAVIPSDPYFYNQATVDDMSKVYAAVYPNFDKQRFEELRSAFNFESKRQMKSLSKGMQKQAMFWLTLSLRPDLLLLDEPADGLDPSVRRQVWGLVMEEVTERGMTVVTSSHNLRELTDICDHVGFMEAGHMHLERTLNELQDNFVRVQVAFGDDVLRTPEGLDVLRAEQEGRLHTLIVRANSQRVEEAFVNLQPVFINILPLSLEEIFIYELGGERNE